MFLKASKTSGEPYSIPVISRASFLLLSGFCSTVLLICTASTVACAAPNKLSARWRNTIKDDDIKLS
jgi:hypothetical protein